jgi:putative membrane protein
MHTSEANRPRTLKRFLQNWLICTLAVLVAVHVVPGIQFEKDSLWTPFIAALLLGILNALLRPLLLLLALPLLVLTLGLFFFVINALLLWLVGALLEPYFYVQDFWSAFWGALVISLVTGILNLLTGNRRSRVIVRRQNAARPPRDNGNGPVIDV